MMVSLVSGCLVNRSTDRTVFLQQNQLQGGPPPPGRSFSPLEDLSLRGNVSARMAMTEGGDLYYAYSQSLYVSDPAETGLPAYHLRWRPRGASQSAEITAPTPPSTATTATVLALKTDAADNLYLLTSSYRLATDETTPVLYRYGAGQATPVAQTLPASFILSNRVGAGFHVDPFSGTLWLAGTRFTATTSFAAAAFSTDGGANWTIRDATTESGSQGIGITTDAGGHPWLAGAKPFGSGFGTAWVVYRSQDGGASFTQRDLVNPTSSLDDSASRAEYIAVTSQGRVLVAGADLTNAATAATSVVVRESTDSGSTWREVARLSDTSGGFYQARGLALGPAGEAYVPILEGKRPGAFLLYQAPGTSLWSTLLSITNLNDGEPYIQAAEVEPRTGSLILLLNSLQYVARSSTLRLSKW